MNRTSNPRLGRLCVIGLTFIFALFALNRRTAGGPAYPLKTAPGKHYMVDQNEVPFLVCGASPWYLSMALSPSNVDWYCSNRAYQGYNSIILDLNPEGSDQDYGNSLNYWGLNPFTGFEPGGNGTWNLATWNTSYYTNMDYVIEDAGKWGLCCFIYPMYDGFGGVSWYNNHMAENPVTNLWQFGNFVGNRYKNFTNIVWIGAGDFNEPETNGKCLWDYIAWGLTNGDPNHLLTTQSQRPTNALYYDFVTVNNSYGSWFTYLQSLSNYQVSPVLASFAREPVYEYNTDPLYYGPQGVAATVLNCRQFAWWAVTSGDAGQFYGNNNEYPFTNGWQSQVTDAVALEMPYINRLFNTRNWTNFVPDANHTVVTSGYGNSGTIDYITTVRESHGYTVVSYFPQDQMTATVAMTNIAGTTANAWWYNPSNGAATSIGSYATTGTQSFTPASANDWVLVLDDAALNYAAPGVTNSPPPEALQIAPATGFNSSGPFGGPFSVTNQNFTLTNSGSVPLNWSLSNTAPWLSISTNGGMLSAGGAGATVSIGLSSAATNLNVGIYSNSVWFTNLNDAVGQGIQFMLTVSEVAPVLTWSNPGAIAYGTALTTNQLDARANVAGSFAYEPSLGAVLKVGTNLLSVIFTPSNALDYSSVTDNVSLVVSLAPVALSFEVNSNTVVLSWNDPASLFVLQGAPALNVAFTNVPGAVSPFSNAVTGSQQFFRLATP